MSADPRVEMLKAAMSQHGGGMPIQVFRGATRYQYGAGVGNILGSIWRFMYPVILRGAASFIKHGGDAYLAQGNVKEALKAGIKPAIGTMIKSAGDELASRVEAPSVSAHLQTLAKSERRQYQSNSDAATYQRLAAAAELSALEYIRTTRNELAP